MTDGKRRSENGEKNMCSRKARSLAKQEREREREGDRQTDRQTERRRDGELQVRGVR